MRIRHASAPWLTAVGLCLCLSASGCLFRQSHIDSDEEHLLSADHAAVDSTQQTYRASIVENGQDSGRTLKACTELNDAQHKLETDQGDYDRYLSASGQSKEPLE